MSTGVCAGVVTYHPDLASLAKVIEAVRTQVDSLVVVDNGSSSEVLAWLRDRQDANLLTVLPQSGNTGAAAAQNRAIEWAREHGFEFILILDQDSTPTQGMVRHLVEAWCALEKRGEPVGAVGPVPEDPRSRAPMPLFRIEGLSAVRVFADSSNDQVLKVAYLISSGTLVKLAVFERVGMMDEGLFIDGVDFEWCFRASGRGLGIFAVPAARLLHSLGDRRHRVWLFGHRQILQHDPTRLYFVVRNALLMARRAYIPAGWVLYSLRLTVKRLVAFGLLVPPRGSNLRMMLAGVRDGILGRTGPLPGGR
jgi:rhamnosyltransferase